MKFYLFLMILIAFFFNCSPSLVYSPTVYPASKPLDKGDIQTGASISMLAEARPEEIGYKTSEGGEAFLRVAVSNTSTAQIKWWRDISDHNFQKNSRSGLSFSSIHKLVYRENSYYLAIMPYSSIIPMWRAGVVTFSLFYRHPEKNCSIPTWRLPLYSA